MELNGLFFHLGWKWKEGKKAQKFEYLLSAVLLFSWYTWQIRVESFFHTPLGFWEKNSGKLLLNTSDMYSFSEKTLWCFQACFLLHIERMRKRWKDSLDCLKNCLTFQKKNLDLIERDEYKCWHTKPGTFSEACERTWRSLHIFWK